MILVTEENYNRVLKENHTIKQEYKEVREKLQFNVQNNSNNNNNNNNNTKNQINSKDSSYYKGVKTTSSNPLNLTNSIESIHKNQMNIYNNTSILEETNYTQNSNNKLEYLKNVLMKYLEAIAYGDQFQIRILENVMFSVLNVSKIEKFSLDDKRARSSFYYSIWYNTKNYISSKIYGSSAYDDSFAPSSTRSNKLGNINNSNTNDYLKSNNSLASNNNNNQNTNNNLTTNRHSSTGNLDEIKFEEITNNNSSFLGKNLREGKMLLKESNSINAFDERSSNLQSRNNI